MGEIRLTQFSHGSGCGCKIAPAVLDTILRSSMPRFASEELLVGYESRDDAAVFDTGVGPCIISTTDFFMPIVDDASSFGAIASVNAISDVYAMGGTPIMALAILGWPIDKLPASLAQEVLDGSREVCKQAGIPLAGGHSIDSPEPIFGLAVTGIVEKKFLKRNNTAREGDLLYLTKPLGTGILSTAQKRGLVVDEDMKNAIAAMTQLNRAGMEFGKLEGVTAMTDVTGFGFLGHLIEVCEGSSLSAEVEYEKISLLPNLTFYTSKMIYPDNTMRNWSSYQSKVAGVGAESLLTLCDPQTSGGLLVCVEPNSQAKFESVASLQGLTLKCMGRLRKQGEKLVTIV